MTDATRNTQHATRNTQHAIRNTQNAPLALYLHIPFCAVRCAYCDFNTYAGLDALFEPYTAALAQEIRAAGEVRGRPPVHTIFIGGGTPTVLPPDLLAQALDACREAFDVAPDAEITSEANPGTVDRPRFAALRGLGVNRLSMGVQSFDDDELRWLGRIHSAGEAEAAFHAARAAGFANINLDFIFGLPDQRPEAWAATLARGIALGPEHLSLYSLIVEHGTALADQVRRGAVAEPDDDLAADLYETACERLAAAGYEQYEISNWARGINESTNQRINESANRQISESANQRINESANRQISKSANQRISESANRRISESANQRIGEGQERNTQYAIRNTQYATRHFCRHNLVYWRRESYLGFGAGAHSFDSAGERRWWNVRPVGEYIRRIMQGRSAEAEGETLDRRTAMGETMMLGLRLIQEGVADARFRAQFGVGLDEAFGPVIERLTARGLLERLPDQVRLTPAGRLLGNQVFAAFLPG